MNEKEIKKIVEQAVMKIKEHKEVSQEEALYFGYWYIGNFTEEFAKLLNEQIIEGVI